MLVEIFQYDFMIRAFGAGIKTDDLSKIPEAGATGKGDINFQKKHAGKIFLQVQSKGEAWYINPIDLKR